MMTHDWQCDVEQFDDGHVTRIVWPRDDLRAHDLVGMGCWCKPSDDGDLIIHNSADGRELFERGERKPS